MGIIPGLASPTVIHIIHPGILHIIMDTVIMTTGILRIVILTGEVTVMDGMTAIMDMVMGTMQKMRMFIMAVDVE